MFIRHYNQELWEKFDIEEVDDDKLIFVSCHTGHILQCNEEGIVFTGGQDNQIRKLWTIIHPGTTANEKSLVLTQRCVDITVFSSVSKVATLACYGAVIGAASSIVIGLLCGALVAPAMSVFGTTVAGIGTFHAPAIAGGVAALLQQYGTFFLSIEGVGKSAFLGALIPCINFLMSVLGAAYREGGVAVFLQKFSVFLRSCFSYRQPTSEEFTALLKAAFHSAFH